jgi:hypothetical protein
MRPGIQFVGIGLVSAVCWGGTAQAQSKREKLPTEPSAAAPSTEETLRAVQRERDALKRRNADLEMRLKQLQTTVDNVVRSALGEQPAPRPSALPPYGGAYARRPLGPFISRFRPTFPPFGGMPDPVELAVAFSEALGEQESAKPALEAAKQKVANGKGATQFDLDAASAQLRAAERKVQLLRTILTTARAVAADEAERMRKLGIAHAITDAEIRNAEARLKIFDEILSADPNAPTNPARSPRNGESKE